MWSPINNDRYKVVATRQYKLGYAENAGSGPTPNAQYFANNDFKLNANFSIDLTKHYIKQIKFNDGSTAPTTRGLFMIMSYAPANGSLLELAFVPLAVSGCRACPSLMHNACVSRLFLL